MTSFGANNIVTMQGFFPTFTIQVQIYHTIGSLLPATNTQPKFLQVYFMDDKEAQVNRRSEYVQGVERISSKNIHVLHDHNILVQEFKMAKDRVTSDNYKVVIHPDRVSRGEYERRFNAPTKNEIAAVVVSSERATSRGIVIQAHDSRLTRVPETHRLYDALAREYPIIFWKGQEGYSFDISQINPFTKQPIPNKKVSCKDFYAYHMMVRRNNFNLLLRCRLLFHQFLVDMYVKVESERLRFIALNQTKLRAENYIHLQDAIKNNADLDPNNLGQMVILIICK
ncbi:ATP-dependent DNA helicase [Trichonephila clavipes]|nr:ATP-dependent DNA helicase [Trichonephila clavipes]